MNKTISYYDNNAKTYFEQTKDVDFSEIYDRFLKYVPIGGTIADLGCGSGRDAAYFVSKGYKAFGVDASKELAAIATDRLGIRIQIADISNWISDKPLDGVWCCASLLHLYDEDISAFFKNLPQNLKHEGAIFISAKTGIETGIDDNGRYMRDFSFEEIQLLMMEVGLEIKESWYSYDKMERDDVKWINIIGVM